VAATAKNGVYKPPAFAAVLIYRELTSEATGTCRRHIHAPDYIVSTIDRKLNMLELIARWGHNVLITLTGLLTVLIILWAA
jgi:hypothetical protein